MHINKDNKTMAKKAKENEDGLDPAYRELKNYKRKDLQKECIKMGIPFKFVCDYSQTQLMSWFINNWKDVPQRDEALLAEYDTWFLYEMMKKGYDPRDPKRGYLFHPAMQMATSYVEENDQEVLKLKKAEKTPKAKIEKPARKKDESGIVSGTKKSLTVALVKQGLKVDKIITKVQTQFPGANANSIKIWASRAQKGLL